MSFVKDQKATRIVVRANSAVECTQRQDESAGTCAVNIGVFLITHELSAAQVQILNRLQRFYASLHSDHVVCDVIAQRSDISLRSIDWLVTNFSKKHNICIAPSVFNIHQNYKTALQQYRRRNFDPFRRRLRLQLNVDDVVLDTTVGQLNFMHWAYMSGVLTYARDHLRAIEEDMNETAVASKRRREVDNETRPGARKRNELSRAPATKCNIFTTDVKVRFDSAS